MEEPPGLEAQVNETTPQVGKRMVLYTVRGPWGAFGQTDHGCKAGTKKGDATRVTREHRPCTAPRSSGQGKELHLHKAGSRKQGTESKPHLRNLRPGSALKRRNHIHSQLTTRAAQPYFYAILAREQRDAIPHRAFREHRS